MIFRLWCYAARCNSTLKTDFFSLASWKSHKKRKTHLIRVQEIMDGGSQPQFISCSSQSSAHSSTSSFQKPLLGSQSSQDHDSLMFVRRDLHKNKQHQARHERDVNNVINAMTSLITDQQSDLNTLQHKVHDMKCEIQGLKKDLGRLSRKENQQKNVRAPQKEVVATTSYTTQRTPANRGFTVQTQGGHDNGAHFRISQKACSSNNKAKKRNSMSDMDIFEKRFRLTGRG